MINSEAGKDVHNDGLFPSLFIVNYSLLACAPTGGRAEFFSFIIN